MYVINAYGNNSCIYTLTCAYKIGHEPMGICSLDPIYKYLIKYAYECLCASFYPSFSMYFNIITDGMYDIVYDTETSLAVQVLWNSIMST